MCWSGFPFFTVADVCRKTARRPPDEEVPTHRSVTFLSKLVRGCAAFRAKDGQWCGVGGGWLVGGEGTGGMGGATDSQVIFVGKDQGMRMLHARLMAVWRQGSLDRYTDHKGLQKRGNRSDVMFRNEEVPTITALLRAALVMCRVVGKVQGSLSRLRYGMEGLWLGYSCFSDEHLVMNRDGLVVRSRA